MVQKLKTIFPDARIAVSLMFFINGFIIGGWALHIPVLAERLQINEASVGLMVLTFGIGSLIGMPVAGYLATHIGARLPMLAFCFLSTPWLFFTTVPESQKGVFIAVFFLGLFVGFVDVVMNAHAVVVEKFIGKAIMSSCHGFWSLGGFIGAGIGGVMISALGDSTHAIAIACLGMVLTVLAWPKAIDDRAVRLENDPQEKDQRFFLPKSPLIYLVGLATFLSMVPEGSALDWGALYMRDEMNAGLTLAGLAFGIFSGAMAIMRFSGDTLRQKYGALHVFRVSVVFAAFGLSVVSLSPFPVLTLVGFALAGLGIANLVPLLFVAAGNLPGVSANVALTIVTAMGYSGMLCAPALIGLVAVKTGLAPIFGAMSIVIALVIFVAPVTRNADVSRISNEA